MSSAPSIASIHPSRSPAFSRNLWLYYQGLDKSDRQKAGLYEGVVPRSDFPVSERWLGYRDGPFVIGSRLERVLSRGGRAKSYAYMGGRDLSEDKGFWEGYLEHGRCYLDPSHLVSFFDSRWEEQGDHRQCLWCGFRQVSVEQKKVVIEKEWISAVPDKTREPIAHHPV